MDWYIRRGDVPEGPFTAENVAQGIGHGRLTPHTLVSVARAGPWSDAVSVPDIAQHLASAGTASTGPVAPPIQRPSGGLSPTKVVLGAVLGMGAFLGLLIVYQAGQSSPGASGSPSATPEASVRTPLALQPIPASSAAARAAAPTAADDSDEAPTTFIYPADHTLAVNLSNANPATIVSALCTLDGQADASITFGLLERSPDRFNRHLWAFNGRAIQVQDVPDTGGAFALVALDEWNNQIAAVFTYVRPPDNVIANHRVRVYGRLAGTFEYTAINGTERSVPKVLAVAMVARADAPHCPRQR